MPRGFLSKSKSDSDDAVPSAILSPRHIILSALFLLGVLVWCFVVWCGFLGGEIEGAVFGKPLALAHVGLALLPGFWRLALPSLVLLVKVSDRHSPTFSLFFSTCPLA